MYGYLYNCKLYKHCYLVFQDYLNKLFYDNNFNFVLISIDENITHILIKDNNTERIIKDYIIKLYLEELIKGSMSIQMIDQKIEQNIEKKTKNIINELLDAEIKDFNENEIKNIKIPPLSTMKKHLYKLLETGCRAENLYTVTISIMETYAKDNSEQQFLYMLKKKTNKDIYNMAKPIYQKRNNHIHPYSKNKEITQSKETTPEIILFDIYTGLTIINYIKKQSEYEAESMKYYYALRPDTEQIIERIKNTEYAKSINIFISKEDDQRSLYTKNRITEVCKILDEPKL